MVKREVQPMPSRAVIALKTIEKGIFFATHPVLKLHTLPDSMTDALNELNEQVQKAAAWVGTLRKEIGHVIVGQEQLVDRLLVGLLANGHVLLEGVPGLAKTLSVRTLAAAIQAQFHRIQFTPDLLPAEDRKSVV